MQTCRRIFLLILLTASIAASQKLSKSDKAYIDSIMNATYKPSAPGAVVLAAKDGKVLFRKAYGMASLELKVKQTHEFLFPLGSIVKQFTSVSILKLCREGKVSLQDDVRKFIPDYNTHGRSTRSNGRYRSARWLETGKEEACSRAGRVKYIRPAKGNFSAASRRSTAVSSAARARSAGNRRWSVLKWRRKSTSCGWSASAAARASWPAGSRRARNDSRSMVVL